MDRERDRDMGRGRARGQSRRDDGQQQQPGQPRPYPSQGRPGTSRGGGGGGGGGAWGGGGGGGSAAPSAWGAPRGGAGERPPAPQPHHQGQAAVRQPPPVPSQHMGRAHHRGGGDEGPGHSAGELRTTASGGGDGAPSMAHSGRGMHRGKRPLHDAIIRTRPDTVTSKKGTSGRTVPLMTNYFTLLQQSMWTLYQYRVDFAPDEDHTGKKKALFRNAVKELNLSGYLFEGTVMYTPHKLHPVPMELFVDPLIDGNEKVRITIKLVSDVVTGDYHYLQVFNIVIRKCMSYLKLQLVGRDYYDAQAKIAIPEFYLELWPGYITSIRQHERDILMCCKITTKVMRRDTVLDALVEITRDDNRDYKNRFVEAIVGKTVLTDYNNKTYRIDDVNFDTTPASKFTKKDGSAISYVDYYKQRYGIRIGNMNQPLLVSMAKPRELRAGMAEMVLLVPELCRMTGLTESQRNNFHLMQALAQYTRVGPGQTIEALHKFARRLLAEPQVKNELRQWNLPLTDKIIDFAGRTLPPEKIYCGNQGDYSAGPKADWTQALQSRQMFESLPITNWVCIFPQRTRQSVTRFLDMMSRASNGMYWRLERPKLMEIPDDRINSYLQAIEGACQDRNLQMIMFIVMNNKNDRYSALKKKCCVDRAIPSQVIVSRNLDNKRSMSIATKVCIQMNCKVGGAPWTVSMPLKKMMVVGYDVCHDPTNKSKSYGAMVASLNSQMSRWFNTASPHTSGEELSNDFALDIIKAVNAFQKVHGDTPDYILIYRDGVGDGQLNYVIEHEVETIKNALEEYYKDKKIKMAFIVVNKRIHTRFFGQGGQNPDPGTIVDDIVTLPERHDFFLISQCTRQGTVTPTSYNIIKDYNFGLTSDRYQILTYKMTHLYYNFSGTVRVPAPCQLAHKLAFLVAQSLHRTPNPQLNNLLYFL